MSTLYKGLTPGEEFLKKSDLIQDLETFRDEWDSPELKEEITRRVIWPVLRLQERIEGLEGELRALETDPRNR
jgi:hypothetical protein